MHRATTAAVVCVALMLTTLTTKAEQIYLPQYVDGNALLDACKSGGGEDSGLCLGYILGVADTLAEWKHSEGGDVCLNPQVPGGTSRTSSLDICRNTLSLATLELPCKRW